MRQLTNQLPLPWNISNQDDMYEKCPLPFRYPGGKHYALNILRPFWEQIPHDEYREPFVGGGSVFFAKPKVSFNWLNDLDTELITTYKVIQDDAKRLSLADRVIKEVASKERWREIFEFKPKNELDVAFKYYYMNRTSFSGKMVSPGWGYRPKRSLPPDRWHERIIPAGVKLKNVKCTNDDFETVIRQDSNANVTLMYVDPPYFSPPKRKHYRHGFEISDHQRLCRILRESPHKFFLTYDDQPEIREMYAWATIYETQFFYRVDNSNTYNGSRREGFELIITNYPVKPQLPELDTRQNIDNDR
jgi:DNA adenine methylase